MVRKLDRLNASNSSGVAFQRLWQRNCEAVEEAFGNLQDQIDAINAAQAAADAAQASANTAQTTATTANAGQLEYMKDIPDVTILADSDGTVDPSSQLPLVINCKRFNDTSSVTTSATWSRTVISGDVTCSINSTTGALTITALSMDSVIEVTSARTVSGQSKTLTKRFNVALNIAQPAVIADSGGSSAGSGGTTATDTSFSAVNSTSRTTISDMLNVTVGSGGQVQLSAPLRVNTGATSPAGTYHTLGIWQWDSTGAGGWVDLGSEVGTSPDTVVDTDAETGAYTVSKGLLSVSYTKTGLTPGSTQDFRLQARNSSGTRQMTFSGTASAVGS